MKKIIKPLLAVLALSLTVSSLGGMTFAKERKGFPVIEIPSELSYKSTWNDPIRQIKKADSKDNQGWIIFYGASNFARWKTMAEDMKEYKVMNHAFGGSRDVDLVYYANDVLFPYYPSVVFFQTGSNDYMDLEGTDEEKIEKCMEYKKRMFEAFHEIMPETKFVVMAGLLLPGRAECLDLTMVINDRLEELAEEKDYIYFVDSEAMTYDGTSFREDLFVEDMIHLTSEGQHLWYDEYIHPAIETVIEENGLDNLRN